ncbi:hypothetical protein ACFFMN_18070 [Planobispora siamensis]|uniref:Uncharacterized protein n=1 Tax=Planobispora siamensis TaxID=936338 RepID=A0A8J3WLT4_9ACTN|nr:hypothetical protein [Planobispora siamensis]GIH92161.1 hypothetical protein Psi01_27910 [Planobispora siamensis]
MRLPRFARRSLGAASVFVLGPALWVATAPAPTPAPTPTGNAWNPPAALAAPPDAVWRHQESTCSDLFRQVDAA